MCIYGYLDISLVLVLVIYRSFDITPAFIMLQPFFLQAACMNCELSVPTLGNTGWHGQSVDGVPVRVLRTNTKLFKERVKASLAEPGLWTALIQIFSIAVQSFSSWSKNGSSSSLGALGS